MGELVGGDVGVAFNLASLLDSLVECQRHNKLFLFALCGGQEVGGYAVSPPELTRDAPVLYVLQPVAVSGYIFCRVEFYLAFEHGWQGDIGKMLHREEPLLAETRLHCGVLVTLRVAYLVVVVLDFLHQSSSFQVFYDLLAHVHTVHAYIHASSLRDGAVGVEDVDGLEVVGLSEGVVVHVVCGCHL